MLLREDFNVKLLNPTILIKLLFNHMDAWTVAFVIAALSIALHDALNMQTGLFLLAVIVGYWLAFALNDYCDAPFDAQDDEKAKGNYFTYLTHIPRIRINILFVTVITLLFFCFAQFGLRGILLFATCVFIMWAYSARPLRLKNRPGYDLFVHAFFVETFPYFMGLVLSNAVWNRLDFAILSILFLSSLSTQMWQQVRDFEVDSMSETNFATHIGRDKAVAYLRVVTAVLLIVCISFIFSGTIPLLVVPLGLLALPATLHRLTRYYAEPLSKWTVTISATSGLVYMGFIFIYLLVLT